MREVPQAIVSLGPRPDHSAVVVGLYNDRGPELWAFGRRLGLAPEECDDAVQEAHLRLWTSLQGGARVDDPAAWLYRVFYRIAMDRTACPGEFVTSSIAGPEPMSLRARTRSTG